MSASNEFIAAIFDCYKNLVRHFRKYGFMKKVYETTREFEAAVRTAFNMVPSEQILLNLQLHTRKRAQLSMAVNRDHFEDLFSKHVIVKVNYRMSECNKHL